MMTRDLSIILLAFAFAFAQLGLAPDLWLIHWPYHRVTQVDLQILPYAPSLDLHRSPALAHAHAVVDVAAAVALAVAVVVVAVAVAVAVVVVVAVAVAVVVAVVAVAVAVAVVVGVGGWWLVCWCCWVVFVCVHV